MFAQLQALGQSKENFVIAAQSKSKNAWAASQAAAFLAFKSGLLADQALYDAQKIRTLTVAIGLWCIVLPVYWQSVTGLPVGELHCQHAGNQWLVGWIASLLVNLGCWACWGVWVASLLATNHRWVGVGLPVCWHPWFWRCWGSAMPACWQAVVCGLVCQFTGKPWVLGTFGGIELPACWRPVLCWGCWGIALPACWPSQSMMCGLDCQFTGKPWALPICLALHSCTGAQKNKLWREGRFSLNWRPCALTFHSHAHSHRQLLLQSSWNHDLFFQQHVVQTTCFSQHPVGRHKKSWEVVHAYVERCLKVWAVKPEQTVLPTILPWLDKTLEDMTFMRTTLEEGIIIWVNLTTCGVVPSMKKTLSPPSWRGSWVPWTTACASCSARTGQQKQKLRRKLRAQRLNMIDDSFEHIRNANFLSCQESQRLNLSCQLVSWVFVESYFQESQKRREGGERWRARRWVQKGRWGHGKRWWYSRPLRIPLGAFWLSPQPGSRISSTSTTVAGQRPFGCLRSEHRLWEPSSFPQGAHDDSSSALMVQRACFQPKWSISWWSWQWQPACWQPSAMKQMMTMMMMMVVDDDDRGCEDETWWWWWSWWCRSPWWSSRWWWWWWWWSWWPWCCWCCCWWCRWWG